MGCDIHFRIERKMNKFDYWIPEFNYTHQSLTLNADYKIFAALANVRNDDNIEHIELKGFPNDADLNTKLSFCCVISDEIDCQTSFYDSDEGLRCVNTNIAAKWVNQNYSSYMEDACYKMVTCPDYHSANWCTFEEYKHALEIVQQRFPDHYINICYKAIYALMEVYAKNGIPVRMVYWFDN